MKLINSNCKLLVLITLFFLNSSVHSQTTTNNEDMVSTLSGGLAGELVSGSKTSIPKSFINNSSIAASMLSGFEKDAPTLRGAAEASIFKNGAMATVVITTNDSIGSGVLISSDGYILTNKHVVGNLKNVTVYFKPVGASIDTRNISSVIGSVYKYNDYNDLALVKVPNVPKYISPVQIETNRTPSVGEDAHAIGHPKGELWSYTRGYVSQVRSGYTWKTSKDSVEYNADVIQTQTPINPGNSGGPLLDQNGKLIGINSFGNPSAPGLNYAVSSSEIVKFLAQNGSKSYLKANASNRSDCQITELSTRRKNVEDYGMVTVTYYDTDCDGREDIVTYEPDSQKFPALTTISKTGSKMIIHLLDTNRDGDPDITFVDKEGDGTFDFEGANKPGELIASNLKPAS